MQVDPKEAARRLRAWNEYGEGADSGTPNEPGYTHDSLDFQRDLRALLSERDAAVARAEAAERERDALRDEWEEIAAGITTEQPEVGALWPMVSEELGNLGAVRNLFKNEIAAHNRTKAERDRLREALENAAIAAEVESAGHAIAIIEAALAAAVEAEGE